MIREELNEQSIQQRLNHFFASWKYNVDGLYVFEWESDKLIWTKNGYIYEFEIKISRADFKNDFKHKKDKHLILQGPTEQEKYMPSCYQSYEWNKKNYASLDAYLVKRHINTHIARLFLEEAHYSFEDRSDGRYLYALAYPKDLVNDCSTKRSVLVLLS